MVNIYLDDCRPTPLYFTPATTIYECIQLMKKYKVNMLSLDHDLGENQPTGYDLCKWMIENNIYPREIYLHSANPVGRMNMLQLLKRYKPDDAKVHNSPILYVEE